ncbi:hypothetical protein CAPTEDRAFT_218524 [Capitella teleta]|uniref:Uncharacterized protein n=1 Tax=Capitella teleta TaxID=283909 RepID=R7VJE9_CAPTE|nr:hypothetical protein CAPTEDRAFT_218524 [Capitella teleta]|eukprot:ELU18789.1 hypothetical protein CAPTEDRAFT_218524 [Capitella teleta]
MDLKWDLAGHRNGSGKNCSAAQVRNEANLSIREIIGRLHISFILSIMQAVSKPESKVLYTILGISLLGFVASATVMVYFVRSGGLLADKHWFSYVIGFAILLESINTDILLYQ